MSYSDLRCYQYFTHLQAQRMKRHLRDSPTLTGVTITGTQISSDTTWNTANIPIDDILVVKSGSALTIGGNTTVKFSQQGRLIIEPGARLYLHGKLTNNDCADTWKGVEVWGKASETQQTSGGIYQQGWLLSYSGASIENADIGLQLWGPDAAQGAGGGVRGVRFIGCRYVSEYDPPSPTDIADYGYGIFAHDAGFEVLPRCVSSTLPCETYARSEFRGLGYGIWLGSEKFAHIAHTVRQADFHDCQIGLSNSGVSGDLMVLNNFYLGRPAGSSFPTRFGVALGNNLNGFTLEENIFTNADPESGSAVGIWAAALGGFNNVIRRNTFIGLTASNFAFLQNAEATIPPRGLYYDCNTNQNSERYDFLVLGSIKSEQGLESGIPPNVTYGPSGNKFAYTGSPDDRDFSNTGSSVNYYYYQSGTDEEPEDYSGIIPTERQFANPCESNYCAPTCETPTEQTQRKQQYHVAKSAFLSALADYQTAVQAENPELAAAKSKLAGYHRKQMDVHAYSIVSHLLYDTTTFHRDTFRLWLGNLDTYGTRISLAGDYWAAGDTTSANTVLNGVSTAYTLTEAQAADFQRVKYLFGNLYGKNIYNLSQNIIDELEVFAADSAGYATGMSQTILRLYGRDYPPIAYLPGEERGQNQGGKKTNSAAPPKESLRVYPNPANEEVMFDLQSFKGEEDVQILVSNTSGQVVWSYAGTTDTASPVKWRTADLKSGMFFFRVAVGDFVGTGRILLHK
ncbi:MAG: T9SS type A sorting domain-containing protein [Saprospiraceae bacterium]|nr:T9SS type A sorting domain-containing protein [Saprospiraceae bacterium]